MNHTSNDIGISVIVPCFNSQDSIEETLGSIINQNVDNMEIIVVDDGSTDKTGEILAKYKKTIKYVYQRNQGVSAARNYGVALAEKEWIAFCDADDVWHPDKIKICSSVIRNCEGNEFIFHDYSVIYGDCVVTERGTHSEQTFFPLMRNYPITIPQILTKHRRIKIYGNRERPAYVDTYSGNGFSWMILGNFIMPSSVLMKRKLFIDNGGFDRNFIVAEDTEFFLRLARDTDFLYIDYPLHSYRRTSKSLISKYLKETIIFGIKGIEKNCLNDKEILMKYKNRIDLSLSRRKADLGYFYLTKLNKKEALRNAVGSLRYDYTNLKAWKIFFMAPLPKWVLRKGRDLKRYIKKKDLGDKKGDF